MAWLSVGTSNEDLCEKMIENEVLYEDTNILKAFQNTDRGDFVPSDDRSQAYMDRPYKRGSVHISAPHMYVTVLEALDLRPGLSFLNVGSGSGYLSCLAAYLLGEGGLSHGIEVAEGMAEYSSNAVRAWHEKISEKNDDSFKVTLDSIRFVEGNCFDIDLTNTVSTCQYDRIYVGAGCPDKRKEFFLSMLSDNGVLVVPINEKNEMIRMRKLCGSIYNQTHVSNVHFAPLVDTRVRQDESAHIQEAHGIHLREQRSRSSSIVSETLPNSSYLTYSSAQFYNYNGDNHELSDAEMNENTMQVYDVLSAEASSFIIHPAPAQLDQDSSMSTAPAVPTGSDTSHRSNKSRVCLPLLIWAPIKHRHFQFPKQFRRAVFTILLVNHRLSNPRCDSSATRVMPALPHQLWLQILSFANRQWFTQPKSEAQLLASELLVERRLRKSVEQKLRDAEYARHRAERERDVFKVMMKRLSNHLHDNPYNNSEIRTGNSGSGFIASLAAASSEAFGDFGLDAFLQFGSSFDDEDDESAESSMVEDSDESDIDVLEDTEENSNNIIPELVNSLEGVEQTDDSVTSLHPSAIENELSSSYIMTNEIGGTEVSGDSDDDSDAELSVEQPAQCSLTLGIKRSADMLMPAPNLKQTWPDRSRFIAENNPFDNLVSEKTSSAMIPPPIASSIASESTYTTCDGGSNISFRSSASSNKVEEEEPDTEGIYHDAQFANGPLSCALKMHLVKSIPNTDNLLLPGEEEP